MVMVMKIMMEGSMMENIVVGSSILKRVKFHGSYHGAK